MTMAFLNGKKVVVTTKFQDKNRIKAVGGRKWNPEEKVWEIPATYTALRELLEQFNGDVLFDDATDEFYREKLGLSEKLTEVKESEDTEVSVPYADKLRDYQRIGVKFLSEGKFTILADEMGTGKTLQAIAGAEESGAEKVLIVCPNTLKWNWQREITYWSGKGSLIINGTKKQRAKQLSEFSGGFMIVNYEALRLEDVFKAVEDFKFDTIICDEAHRLKNRKAKQTKSVASLSKKDNVERVFLLTGTPMLNRADELWSLLNILYPEEYRSYWRFVDKYCHKYHNGFGWEISGGDEYQVEALKDELQSVMIRRTKQDVLKELPKKVYNRMTVQLEGNQRKMYDSMEQKAIAVLNEQEGDVVVAPVLIAQITRLRQIAISTTLMGGDKLQSSKYEAVKDILSDNIDEHKVVIFSQFKEAINELRSVLNENGYKTVSVTGDVSQADREKATEQFQNNPEVRVMLATIQAGGVGLTWTAADIGIFLDRHWTPAINTQAEDRMHRIGQENTVEIINLVAKDTVEEWIEDKLLDKAQGFDDIIDGGARREQIMDMFKRD